MNPTVELTSSYVSFDGHLFSEAVRPEELHDVLGKPSRIEPAGGRPPAGHRNNQIHIYDAMGLVLNEHHFTSRIHEVRIYLSDTPAPQHPASTFSGALLAEGLKLRSGVSENEFRKAAPGLVRIMGGVWRSEELGNVRIVYDFQGRKLASGRRSRSKELVRVSAGLKHDPWQRPTAP